jgi:DNA-binding transcriptional LysR family regulator
LLQRSAAVAGVGLALLPCALGDRHPELVRVEPVQPIAAQEIWLLTHPDLRAAARVSALMSFLAEAFERNKDLLMGVRSWDKTTPALDVVA